MFPLNFSPVLNTRVGRSRTWFPTNRHALGQQNTNKKLTSKQRARESGQLKPPSRWRSRRGSKRHPERVSVRRPMAVLTIVTSICESLSPIGITSRPPSQSCSYSAGGQAAAAAVTMIWSYHGPPGDRAPETADVHDLRRLIRVIVCQRRAAN